jgi:hypothetical protein
MRLQNFDSQYFKGLGCLFEEEIHEIIVIFEWQEMPFRINPKNVISPPFLTWKTASYILF